MATSPTDTDQFLADIAAIRVKAAGRDSFLLRLGAFLMPAGIVLGIVGYALSHNTDNPLDQRDAMIIALIGISVTLTGVALFVRYSLAEFLRFWMARLIHQQEQLVRGAAPGAPAAGGQDSGEPAV
ncbi:hypothetical protein [Aquihabitans sp. McL0605]|uniref:hypothetical protein n=1 Tax=Aquihabitans sp. McL0605 TaxID=3415671 RepID=UPI003CF93F57